MTTVLIIGGYGTFGLRLVRLLSDSDGLTVLVAGRNIAKAADAIQDIDGPATLIPTRLDRSRPLAPQLGRSVDIVVDAVGPFQAYGKTRDLVFDFCEGVGAAYIDLSDDPAFCAHMINRAEDSTVTVATGWSTFSAVTGAALHALGGGIPISGLVPSPRLPMGRAVIDSVLSYAGKAIPGGTKPSWGLTQVRRSTIAPPGVLPMRNLLFANIATPDTVLIHENAAGYVAPQPEILHRILILMARMVKYRFLPRLTLFGGLIHRAQSLISIGEPRGGLCVEADGGRFDLIGDGDTGPFVPVIPAAALIIALHRGERFANGLLRPGADFPLPRLTPWFDKVGIDYGIRAKPDGSLYVDTLGGAMTDLPDPIQTLHDGGVFTGRAQVSRGRNPLARLIANIFGLPKAGEHALQVSITTDDQGREHWSRTYSGRTMFSLQYAGTGRSENLIIEKFGPIAVQLGLFRDGDVLRYQTRGWSLFGIPLPRMLVPSGDVHEAIDAQGRFRFHVDMIAPSLGRLVHYEGWLAPTDPIHDPDDDHPHSP
jgi:NAD(P)-dependent dehydrogenase (short-subunit alcohol dehydrogenase family)